MLRSLLVIFGILAVSVSSVSVLAANDEKPPITLDEFFNFVFYRTPEISPDGSAVVFVTERPDWDGNRYREDLWLYRGDGTTGNLIQLTETGHDSSPQWSPDGRSIAFLSDRSTGEKPGAARLARPPVRLVADDGLGPGLQVADQDLGAAQGLLDEVGPAGVGGEGLADGGRELLDGHAARGHKPQRS